MDTRESRPRGRRLVGGSESTPPLTLGPSGSAEIIQRLPPPLLADPTALRAAREYQRWQEELGNFLSCFDWQLYATPTFRFPVTLPQATRAIEEWVARFGDRAFAYCAYERGHAGGRTHAHVLLGGLVREIAKTHAGRLWTHGDVKIAPYDPRGRAAWYVAKEPEEGQFIGRLQRRTRRPRSRRDG